MDKRLEKITDLDKKVNSDDLIYRYKGNTPVLNFDEFDNALALINKNEWQNKPNRCKK